MQQCRSMFRLRIHYPRPKYWSGRQSRSSQSSHHLTPSWVDARAMRMFQSLAMTHAPTMISRSRLIWNLPNILTYGRVLAVPAVTALLFWHTENWMRWLALAIFAAAAITDYFDGYLARAWQQQS